MDGSGLERAAEANGSGPERDGRDAKGRFVAGHVAYPRRHDAEEELLPAIDGRTSAARTFARLISAIEADLGGADRLSAIERTLIEGYAGAYVVARHLNTRLARGEEIDLAQHAQAVSGMVRVATRLGTGRRARDVTDPLAYANERAP
jgi:hypothetical protein